MTGWTRFTGGLQGGGVLSHRGTKPQREIPISQSLIRNLDRMNKIIRMASGCARCSGWQIKSPSFAASQLALHWMLDCFIRCTNDPACWNNCDRKIRPRRLQSSLPRRIPACRNEQAKNKTSSSSLGRVLLFGPVPFA